MIDEEVRKIIAELYDYVRKMLTARQDVLDRMTHALLERETLDDELRRVVTSSSGGSGSASGAPKAAGANVAAPAQ